MKKITTYLTTLILLSLATLIAGAQTRTGCDKVRGTGNTFATGPATFQGTATVNIGGQEYTATVTTNLLGPPKVTDDGTLLAHTSHTFVFSDGSTFTTFDNTVLSPTDAPGVYDLNTRAEIIQGTGGYGGVSGSLSIHGTISFVSGEVVWRFTGQICN